MNELIDFQTLSQLVVFYAGFVIAAMLEGAVYDR